MNPDMQPDSALPFDPAMVTDQPRQSATADWLMPLLLLAIGIGLLLGLYWPTVNSMVQIWWRSDTFAHGFMILPISLYLIWLKQAELARLRPVPSALGLVAVAVNGTAWLAAGLVDVQVVQQLALVGMIGAMIWAVLGTAVVRLLLFPLGYLFFMVPIGEFLIPPMMEFTAVFSVYLIRLTDIPVYWEGLFISLPSGDWSIVEGCSGVRYLIASIAVGFLYAYLFYHSFWRRAAFIVLAIVTPVIANGFRAFMIIMIGHFSDMKLATGVDHLVYGWLFFGLVIMLMFWIGSFWWDQPVVADETSAPATAPACRGAYWWLMPFALGLLLAGPLLLQSAKSISTGPMPVIPLPTDTEWVMTPQALTAWKPHYRGATATRLASYRRGREQVDLFLYYYRDQSQGAELVNSQNVLLRQKDDVMHLRYSLPIEIELAGQPAEVTESLLRAPRGQLSLLTWNWFWIGETAVISPLEAKLREAWLRLIDPGRGGFAVVMVTRIDDHEAPGHATLQAFTDTVWPAIASSLHQTR